MVRSVMTPRRRDARDPELQVFDIEVGGHSLVVVSLPTRRHVEVADGLTPAEHAVAQLAMTGMSNAAIGRRRQCSARTVANQLASVYRKLGVQSRGELAARLAGRGEK
jgi:DNA-binding CsgD family transcriptional regulator